MQYGTRQRVNNDIAGMSYKKDKLYKYAEQTNELRTAIKEETGLDIFTTPGGISNDRYAVARNQLKDFFVQESYDPDLVTTLDEQSAVMDDMGALFENMMDAMETTVGSPIQTNLNESVALNTLNPIIAMSPMIYKDILINNIFQSAIDTAVAVSPIVPIRHEHRYLVSVDGTKKIDISKQQHMIKSFMDETAPFKEIVITLPENGSVDIIAALNGNNSDSLSTASYISKIVIDKTAAPVEPATEIETVERLCDFRLLPQGFNTTSAQRYLIQDVLLPYLDAQGNPVADTMTVTMNNNKLTAMSSMGKIRSITFKARLDTSTAMLKTCTTAWEHENTQIGIDDGMPLATTVNPSELKDIAALFNIDQLTKVMSIFRDTMANYKDSHIYEYLVDSYNRMPDDFGGKFSGKFDFADIAGYHVQNPESWRHEAFMPILDSYISDALQHLRDPNISVTILGRPDLIRKIEPSKYEYQSPKNIGAIPLEFNRTVTTNHGRQYNFNSSMKINYDTANRNKFRVVFNPTSSERFIYRLYNYQLVISNEIKAQENLALPSVYAFERFKVTEWQPVQGEILAVNPSGFTKPEYANL
jgi:hypothetical protein